MKHFGDTSKIRVNIDEENFEYINQVRDEYQKENGKPYSLSRLVNDLILAHRGKDDEQFNRSL